MSDTLLQSLAFDINGSLFTSQGAFPNFSRNTPAFAEYEVNGSVKLVAAAKDQPRFSNQGSLYLEGSSLNLVTFSADYTHSSWVKGSSINILPNRVTGLSGTYVADRISVSQTLGSQDAQTLYKELRVGSGTPFVATAYLRLAGGRFGSNDRIQISGDVAATQTLLLAPLFNDQTGNYLAAQVSFTSAGTAIADPDDFNLSDTERIIRFSIYVENAVSFDLAGVQIEPGTIRTSFIESEAEGSKVAFRDADSLVYAASPIEGLRSFVFYLNLEQWRGNGRLVECGNFRAEIIAGKLRVTCGSAIANDPDNLPASAQIACRASQGLERLQIYVNKVLKASVVLTGYAASAGPLLIAGVGVRQFSCLYFFNQDLGDGSIAVNQSVLGDMLRLHEQDILFPELSEGYGQIQFSPIKILPNSKAIVKMPGLRSASQAISAVGAASGQVAQVARVTVQSIVNASAVQRDTVTINKTQFEFTSDATPTAAEIAQGLTNMINTAPRLEEVIAAYTASNDFFTVTAATAGDPFYISASPNLAVELTTASETGTFTVTVPNGVDFRVGMASVYRGQAWVTDVSIVSIASNVLTCSVIKNEDYAVVLVGDSIAQNSWQFQFGRNTYFVHHLEDYPDIRIFNKEEESFALWNIGRQERVVTPYLRLT